LKFLHFLFQNYSEIFATLVRKIEHMPASGYTSSEMWSNRADSASINTEVESLRSTPRSIFQETVRSATLRARAARDTPRLGIRRFIGCSVSTKQYSKKYNKNFHIKSMHILWDKIARPRKNPFRAFLSVI